MLRSYIAGICLLAALALPAASTHAQDATGSIVGRVTDTRTAQPVEGVIVVVASTRLAATTGSDGSFRIINVPAGAHTLRFRRLGYDTAAVHVTVRADAESRADVSLNETAAVIVPVVVSATREQQRRTENSATIDVLEGSAMRLARASHPAQVLKRVSGVYVSQLSGEGHSMAIRQPITTKPMYLYLEDGVPTRATGFFNHNALYEVNLPQSGGLEVLKGPGTALYGSDAIGGVINALTRPAPLTTQGEATVEGGEYGWRRALLSAGTTVGRHGLRADLNITSMEGWRAQSPYDRQSGTLRWELRMSDALTARTVVTASKIDQNDVLTQNDAQFRARSTLNRSPLAFRHVEALRYSTAIDYSNGKNAWSVTPFARRNVLDLVPFWQLTFDPQIWESHNTSLGVLARYRRDFDMWRSRMIAGVDIDRSPGTFVADQAVLASTGTGAERVFTDYTRGAKHYDYNVTFLQTSPYVHVETSPFTKLRLDAGVRYDRVSYDYSTNIAPTDTGAHRVPASQQRTYNRASPKIGATLDISRALNVYGSYRRGFRAPSHSNLFQQNTSANSTDLQPVIVASWEGGLRGEARGKIAWSLTAYDMNIDNDIITFVTAQNTREATNAGRTSHRGIEAALGARVTRSLRIDLSAAMADHKYVEWRPQAARQNVAEVRYDGNRIEGAPATLANGLVTWSPAFMRGGRIGVEWSHTGRYDTDPANVAPMYGGHELFTLHANTFVRPGLEVFGRLVNVGNRNQAELVTFDRFQGLQYTPGNPRSLYMGVRVSAER